MSRSAASRRIAGVAVLTALALIAFLLEGMLPPMFIPGAKLGLGNIFVTIVLVVYSPVFAVISVIVKCVIGNLIAGSLSTMLYSLAAGLVSIGLSSLLLYGCRRLSLTAVSVASACVHNTVQCLVFCGISGTPQAIVYLPYLVLLGALSGAAVGIAAQLLLSRVPETYYLKLEPALAPNFGAGVDKTTVDKTDNGGRS